MSTTTVKYLVFISFIITILETLYHMQDIAAVPWCLLSVLLFCWFYILCELDEDERNEQPK